MDRINFLKSIDLKEREFASTIVTFFDQCRALYSLGGSYDNSQMSNESGNSISFNINLSENDLDKLISAIISVNNQLFIYDRIFNVIANKISSTCVQIIINY